MDKDLVSQFEGTINRINVIYGLLIPIGSLVLTAAVIRRFYPEYFQSGSLPLYYCIIATVALAVVIHITKIKTMPRSQVRFLYIHYHIALGLYCVFVAPFSSPMNVLWVVLAIGMDQLFGRRWTILTFIIYLIVTAVSFVRADLEFTGLLFLVQVLLFIGLTSTVMMVSKFRQVSDEEREVIGRAFTEKEYERQRLLSLINNMGEAVVAIDKYGKILIYNSALLALLDTNDDVQKKDISTLFRLKNNEDVSANFGDLIKKKPQGFSTSAYTHTFVDGEKINLFLSVAPIRLGYREHNEVGSIVIVRDITKEKSIDEAKDEFISVVGHELRTPTAIAEGAIGTAMVLAKKEKTDRRVIGLMDQAHQQVIYLANMVNDIATLSRAERGGDELELTEVKPSMFLKSIGESYQQEAKERGLTLLINCSQATKPIVTVELYLHEILQNIIVNALKYTKEGSVTLSVKSLDDGRTQFTVTDTGIGLSKADKEKIFEKFYRSEDYHTRESGGTGLGLYITKKLADKIKATIKVESELSKGSTFIVTVSSDS